MTHSVRAMRVPSLRRSLPMSSKVLFGVAGALTVASFLLVRGEVQRAERAQLVTGPRAAVVVAVRDLIRGQTVAAADVEVSELPQMFVPPGAVTSADQAVGRVAIAPVKAGEVLALGRLSTSSFGGGPYGQVVVTVGFAAVPEGLSSADRVDAYATYAGARPYTTLVGEDLEILTIHPGEDGYEGSAPTMVTLSVDAETARQLFQASAAGTLALAARSPTTTSPTPTVTPEASAAPS